VTLERLARLDGHGIDEDLPRQWAKEIAGNGGENREMVAIFVILERPFTEKLTRNGSVQHAVHGNFWKC